MRAPVRSSSRPEDLLAPVEAPHHRGHQHAHVLAEDPGADQVAAEAAQLAGDGAQAVAALVDLEPGELLAAEAPAPVVEHGGGVVHAVGEGDVADVGAPLEELLHRAVEVAEDHLEVHHRLAVEGDEEVEYAVGAGVVGPEVELDQVGAHVAAQGALLLGGEAALELLRRDGAELGHSAGASGPGPAGSAAGGAGASCLIGTAVGSASRTPGGAAPRAGAGRRGARSR